MFHLYFYVIFKDKVTILPTIVPTRNLTTDLLGEQELDREGYKKLEQFRQLLDSMTQMDSSKRISCADALNHPFIMER